MSDMLHQFIDDSIWEIIAAIFIFGMCLGFGIDDLRARNIRRAYRLKIGHYDAKGFFKFDAVPKKDL